MIHDMMTAARTIQASILIGLAAALAGCTIQIGEPNRPAPVEPTPTTEAKPQAPIIVPIKPKSCDKVYELMLADGSPGRSEDLNVAIKAINEATVAALADPKTQELGQIIEVHGHTLYMFREAQMLGAETDSNAIDTLQKQYDVVVQAFLATCEN